MNLDTIGCVWTGELDLNTLRVDWEVFESGKKELRIKKYPDTCGPYLVPSQPFFRMSRNTPPPPPTKIAKETNVEKAGQKKVRSPVVFRVFKRVVLSVIHVRSI